MGAGDYILISDIRDEAHLEHIRSIVRDILGYKVGERWGKWGMDGGLPLSDSEYEGLSLELDWEGDLIWAAAVAVDGRRWLPSELGAD